MAVIKGGFSFDGVDIADIGLTYAPEISNIYVYKPAAYKLHEQAFDAHDGGYYYGNTMQPKDFTLRCIFEESPVLDGVMSKIDWLFHRGKTGRLVFAKRPWLWYTATVVSVNASGLTNRENGIVVIQMRAYYPFARSDQYYTDHEDVIDEENQPLSETQREDIAEKNRVIADMRANSAMGYVVDANDDLAQNARRISSGNQVVYDFLRGADSMTSNLIKFPVINPGTERAAVCVEVGGTFNKGLTITNHTNSEVCRFIGGVSDKSQYIQCDALNGRVSRHGSDSNVTLDYVYHDYGFIYLEPAGVPLFRSNGDVQLQGNETPGHNSFTISDQYDLHLPYKPAGYWVYDEDTGHMWKIASVSGYSIWCEPSEHSPAISGDIKLDNWMIIKANEISIQKGNDGDMNLHRMRFVFKPTFP